MPYRFLIAITCVSAITCVAGRSYAGDVVAPGEPVVEEPTFLCLGFEWPASGDDNRNASVTVSYRRQGGAEWRQALDLLRVNTERMPRDTVGSDALFAGSIFDLEPGSTWEIALRMSDPDGGGAERILTVQTRALPALPPGMRVRYVVPGDGGGAGTSRDPFRGLAAANAAAQPGDDFQLGPGVYEGPFKAAASGTAAKPIRWTGPSDGAALIDGAGGELAVDATGLSHVWFEHLTIRNAEWGIAAHESSHVIVRRCRVRDVSCGYAATRSPVVGNVVSDCIFEGRVPWTIGPRHVTPYTMGKPPEAGLVIDGRHYDITDMCGIDVAGEGTIVAHNLIRNFGDAIHGSGDRPKVSVDIYGNEIIDCPVDGIEADYGLHNIRIFDNRMTNVFQGISAQPVLGGPAYFIRNVMYNVDIEPYKLHNSPSGVIILNNTSVRSGDPGPMVVWTGGRTSIDNVTAFNNLFVGGTDKFAIEITAPARNCRFDYNGYAGGPWKRFARLNGIHETLEDFRKSGYETHGVAMRPEGLFATGVMPPENAAERFPLSVNDLRPAKYSAAVDAGVHLANVTDGFAGKAPDLGAYEFGRPLPHYGPRPREP